MLRGLLTPSLSPARLTIEATLFNADIDADREPRLAVRVGPALRFADLAQRMPQLLDRLLAMTAERPNRRVILHRVLDVAHGPLDLQARVAEVRILHVIRMRLSGGFGVTTPGAPGLRWVSANITA